MPGNADAREARLRRATSLELTGRELAAIRELLWSAFVTLDGGWTEHDWEHALGGVHVLLEIDGDLVGHASVIEREIEIDGHPFRTGYVEAVAVDPGFQRRGYGTQVMAEVGSYISDRFELGALATGTPEFYGHLGWLRWTGPTFVRTDGCPVRTPEDDAGILVLPTPTTPPYLDRAGSISCEWRPGDAW